MNADDVRRILPRPELMKLQQITSGLQISKVRGENVLIEPIVPRTDLDRLQREGLIAIPEGIKKEHTPRPSTGIVLAVGDFVNVGLMDDSNNWLEPGMLIMFSKYAGLDFLVDEKAYKVLNEKEVCCVLEAVEGKTLSDVVKSEAADQTPDVPLIAGKPLL